MSRGLVLEMRVGERLPLDGGRIVIALEHKHGQRARIRVEADRSVLIGTPQPLMVRKDSGPKNAGTDPGTKLVAQECGMVNPGD